MREKEYKLYDCFIFFGHRGYMPRAFTEAERERIRERLIVAGKKSLNRAGMRLLVVDDVAREAGISKGSFYSFFPSREDFILSIFESWEIQYRDALLASVAQGEGSARERLERFFLGAFEMLRREPGLAQMGSVDIQRLVEALPAERIAVHQANDNEVLDKTFGEWARAGLIDPEALMALPGIVNAIFAIALHKDDFVQGGYDAAVKLISESLAMRLASGPKGSEP
jgi:AcrR family transcriptional regulator